MQLQHAEYGLSGVPLRQSAWNHDDPPAAWEFPGEVSASGVHSLLQTCANVRADTKPACLQICECAKPAAEAMGCIHQNAPVIDDLNAIVTREYKAEGYNNSAKQNPLRLDRLPAAFLGFQQQQYGELPGIRFSGSQTFAANESKPPLQNAEGTRTVLPKPPKDRRNEAFEEQKSLGLVPILQRENRILSERQRRSGMNQLYAKMQSVLPNIGAQKADKASLVTEMIKYIQSLQRRLHVRGKELQGIVALQGAHGALPVVKSEPIATFRNSTQAASSSACNASISTDPGIASPATNIAGGEPSVRNPFGHFTFHCDSNGVFITVVCQKKANLLPSIILVLECYDLEIMDAFVSTTDTEVFNYIHLKAAEIVDPQTTETLKGTLQKLMRSDFQINFPRLTIETEAIKP